MIEIISSERCTGCNICVHACPTNVFDMVKGQAPRIARQSDCQTCFLCELYCPSDALYVDPTCDRPVAANVDDIRAAGLIGKFRRESGWHEWQEDPRYPNEHWRMGENFADIRKPPAALDS